MPRTAGGLAASAFGVDMPDADAALALAAPQALAEGFQQGLLLLRCRAGTRAPPVQPCLRQAPCTRASLLTASRRGCVWAATALPAAAAAWRVAAAAPPAVAVAASREPSSCDWCGFGISEPWASDLVRSRERRSEGCGHSRPWCSHKPYLCSPGVCFACADHERQRTSCTSKHMYDAC